MIRKPSSSVRVEDETTKRLLPDSPTEGLPLEKLTSSPTRQPDASQQPAQQHSTQQRAPSATPPRSRQPTPQVDTTARVSGTPPRQHVEDRRLSRSEERASDLPRLDDQLITAVTEKDSDRVRWLLDNGASANATSAVSNKKYRALHIAVENGDFKTTNMLLEAGADLTAKTVDGKNVIHLAVMRNKIDVLRLLVHHEEKDQIINSDDNKGTPPLFHAIYGEGNESALKLLLDTGADITKCDNPKKLNNQTTNQDAAENKRNVVQCAVEQGNHTILKALFKFDKLKQLAEVKDNTYQFQRKFIGTALHISAYKGDEKCMTILLQNGYDTLSKTSSKSTICKEYTPLHLAASGGKDDVIQVVVNHIKERIKKQPAAQKSEHDDEYHEQINAQAEDGWTPLHLACENRRRKTVKLLLKSGADLSATCTDTNRQNNSAMDLLIYQVPLSVGLLKDELDSSIELKQNKVTVDYKILMPPGNQDRPMKVMNALLNTGDYLGQQKLLAHPVVESYLRLQWRSLRIMFYVLLAINFVFIITFSVFAYQLRECPREPHAYSTMDFVLIGFSVLSGIPLVIHDVLILFRNTRKNYLRVLDDKSCKVLADALWKVLLDATFKVLGYTFCVLVIAWPECPKEITTSAILLIWSRFVRFFAHDPVYGKHMYLFMECVANFSKIMISFGLLIAGFVIAFAIEFQGNTPFKTITGAIAKTIVMMTTEFEYTDLSQKVIVQNTSQLQIIFGEFVVIMFVLLIGVVLMNLLTAKAVTVINNIDFMRQLAEFVCKYDGLLYELPFNVLPERFAGEKHGSTHVISISKDYSKHSTKFPEELKISILETAYQTSENEKTRHKLRQEKEKEEKILEDIQKRLINIEKEISALKTMQLDQSPH